MFFFFYKTPLMSQFTSLDYGLLFETVNRTYFKYVIKRKLYSKCTFNIFIYIIKVVL
jgi:hypothetical protein